MKLDTLFARSVRRKKNSHFHHPNIACMLCVVCRSSVRQHPDGRKKRNPKQFFVFVYQKQNQIAQPQKQKHQKQRGENNQRSKRTTTSSGPNLILFYFSFNLHRRLSPFFFCSIPKIIASLLMCWSGQSMLSTKVPSENEAAAANANCDNNKSRSSQTQSSEVEKKKVSLKIIGCSHLFLLFQQSCACVVCVPFLVSHRPEKKKNKQKNCYF